ncbi:Uncharacterised protein [Serratia fonticola]|uniref:Uncharacterized protein n=1 Tax=Serratia fonticola TaxID=47917 RepID=A0A4U9VCM5_SERFO|nr:Uncharacterised protein [Serratia fonticola]
MIGALVIIVGLLVNVFGGLLKPCHQKISTALAVRGGNMLNSLIYSFYHAESVRC